jgi:peptidoglycan/LPS O-acetylase OafA/YrhL
MPTGRVQQHIYPRNINLQIHGLRGFSALIVFIYHVYGISAEWHFWPTQLANLDFVFHFGGHGVDLFFIISGYLITGSLIRHRSAALFLIDRCIRIYPVFLAIHLLVFGLGPFIGYRWLAGIAPSDWVINFASNLAFLPGVFDLPLAQLSAWSLSYEAAFYLTAAALYIMATRLGRLPALLIGMAFIIPFLAFYPRASFFLVGAAAYASARGTQSPLPAVLRLASLLLLILTFFLLVLGEQRTLFTYVACLPGFAFFLSCIDGRCLLSRLLRFRFLQYLGTISYSFYLWFGVATYPLKIAIAKLLYPHLGSAVSILVFGASGFLLSVAVSQASNVVLEVRIGRWLRQYVRGRRRLAPLTV